MHTIKLLKHIKSFACGLLATSILVSCSNFEEMNTNPDASTSASPTLLANGLILNLTSSSSSKPFYASHLVGKMLAWGESADGNQYNSFGRTGFGAFTSIIDAQKMLDLTVESNRAGYEGLYYFVKAYKLFELTMAVGDIPYSEAFQGESGLMKPKYDTQKDVLLGILEDLNKAYLAFDKNVNFAGDPIYKGSSAKWKKATRALQLRILMHLSNKESDADLKVKERFAQLAQSSLMESNADNFQRVYSDNEKEFFPVYYTRTNHNDYAMLSYLIVDKLKETGDYRLFYYAKPADIQTNAGISADNPDAYLSVDPSAPFDVIGALYSQRKFSNVNERYTNLPSGEPIIKLGYAEQQFILAEAALRGWIPGSASQYYKEGIRKSMEFVASNTPDNVKFNHGRKITEAHIQSILDHPLNQLPTDFEKALEMIITQKYLSSFLQREWEVYYDYRRTGYPVFPINPSTNQNTINTQLPTRWMYPTSEYDTNKENVEAAVKRQWNGVEDENKVLWMLQK